MTLLMGSQPCKDPFTPEGNTRDGAAPSAGRRRVLTKCVAGRLISYCARHCKPKPQMSGLRLASKEEEAQQQPTGDDGNGLWNAQLFPPPALVPVPECSSGCARQEAIQVSWNTPNGSGLAACR